MTYAHHSFSEESHEECVEKRRVNYTRGRSYLAERRRRGRKRSANGPSLTINGRRRRHWTW